MIYHTAAQRRAASPRQRSTLAQIARRAWQRVKSAGKYDDEAAFRRAESEEACGRRISESLNGDFLLIGAHFLTLAGDEGEAFEWHLRWQREAQRVGQFAVERECERFGFSKDYAERIAVDRFSKPFADLTVDELHWLAWTLRNNGLRARRKITQTQTQTQT